MATTRIPVLVKHVALAIYKSGDIGGTKTQKVLNSFNIAVGRLVEYGYLWKKSSKGPDYIQLTVKGRKRNRYHQREQGGKKKTMEWDALYALIQTGVEEEDGDATVGTDPPAAGHPSKAREQQKRRRLTRAAKAAPRTKKRRPKRAKKAKRARRG